jgi:hypothetical protein
METSSNLRLNRPRSENAAASQVIIDKLGLTKVADNVVGTILKRGENLYFDLWCCLNPGRLSWFANLWSS